MLSFNLCQLSELFHGELRGKNIDFSQVSIDSRTLQPNDAFIAISGPNFDGHDFVSRAKEQGASCAIVSNFVDCDLPQLKVHEPRKVLAELARLRRNQLNIPIVAVTGSCGKTTTRSMLASILKQKGNVNASEASYNNNLGLPLTLLKTNTHHDFCVLEMGANHPNEIAYLTQIARPNVAIITMAAPAHLAGFGDLQGVAKAKGEIFQGLDSDGTAVLNQDDEFFHYWQGLVVDQNMLCFGLSANANVWATGIQSDGEYRLQFRLHHKTQSQKVCLPLMGEHHVNNALAAATACLSLGFSLDDIVKGLEAVEAVDKRMILLQGLRGAQLLDDTYNAIPTAVLAAINVLANSSREKIFVFGAMGELGEKAEAIHQQIGHRAKEQGIDYLFTYGDLAYTSAEAFGPGAEHFDNQQLLVEKLSPLLTANTTVLVKGSRAMKMENIVSALKMEPLEQ